MRIIAPNLAWIPPRYYKLITLNWTQQARTGNSGKHLYPVSSTTKQKRNPTSIVEIRIVGVSKANSDE